MTVGDETGQAETYQTTEEHPFYVDGKGWVKASLLEADMALLDRYGNATLKVIKQHQLDKTDTVYNFEVENYHTYHIGALGVWVHNDKCCELLPKARSAQERRNLPGTAFSSTELTELKFGEDLFNGRTSTKIPKQVADKLSGRKFNNFDEFRKALWKEMANDPAVARNFNLANLALMKNGKAPFVISTEQRGMRKVYELDHHTEIQNGGAAYNLDNIVIRTPNNHINKTKKGNVNE